MIVGKYRGVRAALSRRVDEHLSACGQSTPRENLQARACSIVTGSPTP